MSKDISYKDILKTFGGRLRAAREGESFTQQELAEACGITQRQVSRYENDKVIPRKKTVKSLAETLRVDENWLLKGRTEEEEGRMRPDNVDAPDYVFIRFKALADELGVSVNTLLRDAMLAWVEKYTPMIKEDTSKKNDNPDDKQ